MVQKIKVLRIITRLSVGGSSIHVILLTAHLDKTKFQSILVKGSEGQNEGNLKDLVNRKKINPVFIPELRRKLSLRDDLLSFWKLYRLISREKPHIVHTHSAKAGTLGRLAARLAGVPFIVHTYHGHLFRGYFSTAVTKLIVLVERFLSLLSTKIIAVTQSQKEELLQYKITPSHKLVTIPLGLELDSFLKLQKERGRLRAELGLSSEDLLIGSIARLVPVKGHSFLLRAAKRVVSSFPNAKFLIVGDGELREKLENLASRLGIKKNVIFCGFRRDLPKIYADLDIVALTSLNEGLPVAVIEAMTSQTPVIAYEVGGVKDLIEPNVNGILLPCGEIDGLANSIIYLLKNPKERRKLGQKGQEKVYPKLHYKRLVQDFEKFYSELMKNRFPRTSNLRF